MLFTRLIHRLRDAHPDHHAIARGMAWVTLFVLLGSVARAAREVAIAYRYGVSAEVDAYLFVFNLVSWPVAVWFSVLTVVLVPLAARIRQNASAELPRFRSELLGLTLLLGLVLAFLGWLGLPFLLRSSWTGLPEATVDIAFDMVTTLTLLAPLGVVISLFSVWMLVASRHANTLLESLPAIVVLTALLAFPDGGVELLVWSAVAGVAFHLVSLSMPLARKGEIEVPRFTRQSPQWIPFWQGFGFMLGGQALMSFTGIIDQFFAAPLGTGAIAELGYANRILTLLLALGAAAVSRATLPVFSHAQARGETELTAIAFHWIRLLFVVGLIMMIIAWGTASWGVKVLFQRGAFTPNDTQVVAEIIRYGLAQLPFYFAGLVMVSLLVSQGKYHVLFIIGAVNLVVKVVFNALSVPYFGVSGLMIATSAMSMFSCILLVIAVFRKNLKDHRYAN
jgi:putative peptidoglycan lipid II flippase